LDCTRAGGLTRKVNNQKFWVAGNASKREIRTGKRGEEQERGGCVKKKPAGEMRGRLKDKNTECMEKGGNYRKKRKNEGLGGRKTRSQELTD